MRKLLLQKLPSVTRLLEEMGEIKACSHSLVVKEIRSYLDELRQQIASDGDVREANQESFDIGMMREILLERIRKASHPKVCRAINATGVVLHTGLGRSPLPSDAISCIANHLKGYAVLEIDTETGKRSQRDMALRDLLTSITGAEDAMVVNNNAAAVLIMLAALAHGKEVIVNRGQLVEIGGSFRIPDIIAQSGACLIEVGCTNRSRIEDYESAVSPNTAAILHVHASNFKIMGFESHPHLKELGELARAKNVLLLQDSGSGALANLFPWGLQEEPLISESIANQADVVTFSGDKLLGACQAGLIVGKRECIEKLRKHPLARALRVDKVTLSILETTLKFYRDPEKASKHIPTLRMLNLDAKDVEIRAQKIARSLALNPRDFKVEVLPCMSKAGSGAFPIQDIPSYAVTIRSETRSVVDFARLLRVGIPPVFSRIQDNTLFLDPRTLLEEEDQELIEIIQKAAILPPGGKDCIRGPAPQQS